MNKLEKLQELKRLFEQKKYRQMVQTAFSADGVYADANEMRNEPAPVAWSLVGKRTIGDTEVTDWHFAEAAEYIYLKVLEDEKREIDFRNLIGS